MLASLPMYDHPAIRDATDRFWQAIRRELGDGPEALTREGDLWDHWTSPDLLLSQTCGYPYRARLHRNVQLVATPDYGLPGCGPGEYNSVFVARAEDTRRDLTAFEGARFAYNEAMSQSGWAAPMLYARAHQVTFGTFQQSGGHALSAKAVAEGEADLAALDALTWKMIRTHEPFAGDLVEIAQTPPTPTLPYIAALFRDPAPIREAMARAIQSLSPEDRSALSLVAVVDRPAADYLAIPSPPPPPQS